MEVRTFFGRPDAIRTNLLEGPCPGKKCLFRFRPRLPGVLFPSRRMYDLHSYNYPSKEQPSDMLAWAQSLKPAVPSRR